MKRLVRVIGDSALALKLDANLWVKRIAAFREQPFGFCLHLGGWSCFLFSPRDSVEIHATEGREQVLAIVSDPRQRLLPVNVIRGWNQFYMIDTDEFLDGAASAGPQLRVRLRRLSQ